MNVTKNGIPIAVKSKPSNRFATIPNIIKTFVTLTRKEDEHIVWLVTPFYKDEIRELKSVGWRVIEVWKEGESA